jgi:hypothetical protein
MSSPRAETTHRPDDPEQPGRTQLSAVQISAGALAAVSSAVVASLFGVAGTLVGAALASVISTICATLYSESLKRTNERLRVVRQQLGGTRANAAPARSVQQPVTPDLPSHLDPRRSLPRPRRRPRWTRVAGYAAAVFGLAMGILTGVELIGQQPVSALVGGSTSSGTTTIGTLSNAASSRETTPASPSSTPPAPSTAQESEPTTTPPPEDTGTDVPAGTSETPTSSSPPSPTTSAEPTPSPTQTPQTPQRSSEQPATEAEPTS